MIDLGVPTDSLVLYNFSQNIKLKTKESFAYIFNDNIDYLTNLYNKGIMSNITFDNIVN